MISDEAKKVSTFEGKVVLTQGSLIIRADRIVVRQDGDGFYHGVASGKPATFRHKRSEEHTSELQSLAYLVCRLLLEKKKKKQRSGWYELILKQPLFRRSVGIARKSMPILQ